MKRGDVMCYGKDHDPRNDWAPRKGEDPPTGPRWPAGGSWFTRVRNPRKLITEVI